MMTPNNDDTKLVLMTQGKVLVPRFIYGLHVVYNYETS